MVRTAQMKMERPSSTVACSIGCSRWMVLRTLSMMDSGPETLSGRARRSVYFTEAACEVAPTVPFRRPVESAQGIRR